MAWPTPNYYDYDKGNNINLLELLVDSQLEVDGSEDFSGDSEVVVVSLKSTLVVVVVWAVAVDVGLGRAVVDKELKTVVVSK